MRRLRAGPSVDRSAFAGFRFPAEVITGAIRWYLRYGLSYRDVEELLAERGVEVDHVTVYRWVQRFTPLFTDAARPLRHATGDRWCVDETYVKVAGQWRYLYRAADQYGQVIDVMMSEQRDSAAARRFFTRALAQGPAPVEVTTDKAGPYLRYGLSYRDVEELLAERAIEVDHVTVYRWVQRFTPLFAEAARPLRHAIGDRWFVDETYVKVAGRWRYLYRAVDQYGQVIDVLLSEQRDTAAARRFFTRALAHGLAPVEVTTDKAGPYLRVLDELVPTAAHVTEQYSNNSVESDHGRLKARLRPMRGLKRFRSAARIAAGHAFVQNLRRGHYELATDVSPPLRLATTFTELAMAM